MVSEHQIKSTDSLAKNKAINFISDYHKIIIVIIVTAVNFYIRNPLFPLTLPAYKNGLAIAWLIWPLLLFYRTSDIVKLAGTLFMCLMAYCLVDNLSYDMKHFTTVDIFYISCSFTTVAIYAAVGHHRKELNFNLGRKDIATLSLLTAMAFFIIAGRVYADKYWHIFSILNWDNDMMGTPYYCGDALAGILSSILFMYIGKGIEKVAGLIHLLLTSHNYYVELMHQATENRLSKWVMVVIIVLASVYVTRFYVRKFMR